MESYLVEKFIIETKPPPGKRIPWIDLLKGVGIILVVFGHAQVPRSVYLYSFHMPLFFFISGYLFRGNPSTKFRDFVKKRTISLVIPYFFWSFVSIILYFIYEYINGNSEILYVQLNRLLRVFDGNANNGGNDSIWFLSCLFITAIIYYIFDRCTKNSIQIVLILICSSIAGYLYSMFVSIALPWKAHITFPAVVFYGAGHLFHKNFDKLNIIERFKKPFIIFILAGAVLLHIFTAMVNVELSNIKRVNMVDQVYGNHILFYLAAFLGIFIFVNLALLIKHFRIIELIGQSSLLLLATHKLVFYLIPTSIIEYIDSLHLTINIYEIIVYTLLAILASMPMIFFFNKFLPVIVGKNLIRPLQIIIDLNFGEDEEIEISAAPKETRNT